LGPREEATRQFAEGMASVLSAVISGLG